MIIHVVKQGETIQSIADFYEVSVDRLILENEIPNPDNLIAGQDLVILFPKQTYVVREGDTLSSIANEFDISVLELIRNNPYLSNREFIFPGEELVISYMDNKIMNASVNGYTYPFIDSDTLRKTLPYLTYLTIFNYMVTYEGDLIDINDRDIIEAAKLYGVAPIMLISTRDAEGYYDIYVINHILASEEIQNRLINNALDILSSKGYYGLTIDFPYISPTDREGYVAFVDNMTQRLNAEGYIVNITLSPSTFEVESGFLYRGFDYASLGQVTDGTMLLSYEWGFTYGPPISLMPLDLINDLIEYAVTQIPPNKTYIGIPSVGYLWRIPYIEGTRAAAMSYLSAIRLAEQVGATIQFDEFSQTAFYQYVENVNEYFVRFKDSRSINVRLDLVPKYGFAGFGVWNIVFYFPQLWLLVNNKFGINKVLDPLF
ncbi:MAG: LysM peptidoglycan-binding domain-containing protein [Clostridiales bacterium]|nr:LysM peptidoglycan-binding domain-containing protein [Clostridiales bacterium]